MSLSEQLIISQQNLTAAKLGGQTSYEFENFRLDVPRLMLYRDTAAVSLKPKVVETLVALVERHGEIVSNKELMDRLWADSFVEESNLTQNIYLLRKVLGNGRDGKPFIENFSRRGYRFNGEVREPRSKTQVLVATHTRTQTVVDEVFESGSRRRLGRWIPAAVALVAGATIVAVGYGIWGVRSGNSSRAANVPFASFQSFKLKRQSDTGDVTSSAVSADGKFIAYADTQNSIWLKNTSSDSVVQVLPASTVHRGLMAISPDNDFLYVHVQAKETKSEIVKVPVFGGSEQSRIAIEPWSDAALSPDGKQLVFVRVKGDTGQHELISANSDGSGERVIATAADTGWFGVWSQSTAWSPDGALIACAGGTHQDGKETGVIRIFRPGDGELVSTIPIEPEWNFIDSIVWLADGDLMTISSNNSTEQQIFKYAFASGEWRRITNDLTNYHRLSASADGRVVVTVQFENFGNLWMLPATGDKLQARQITTGRNLLTDTTGISWTPDGRIVYGANSGGKWGIWMIDPDGQNAVQLTQNCAGNDTCGEPIVTPDGRLIVFQAKRDGVRNIWRMESDGSNPTQLTYDGGAYPSLTNDGSTVVYVRPEKPATTLQQVPIEGGEKTRFSAIDSAASVAFTRDGERMAFGYYDAKSKDPWKTCVAAVNADAPDKCFGNSRSYPRWAADGKSFYYLDHDYRGVWKQFLDGQRSMFLEFPGERTDNFVFSPDGKSLVVARSKQTQDVVSIIDESR